MRKLLLVRRKYVHAHSICTSSRVRVRCAVVASYTVSPDQTKACYTHCVHWALEYGHVIQCCLELSTPQS